METNTCADQTPLSLAAQKGNTEVCRLLLEKGADTEAIDSSTWTPLHHAVNGGFLDTCRLLVESKIRILDFIQKKKLMNAANDHISFTFYKVAILVAE